MELPARLGKYELIEFLGGGMSHVYRAVDTVINRTVAVKILTDQGCADEEVRARFLQEGRTAGNISHENILTIYDFGEDHGRPFMVMEFLRGEDLRHALNNGHVGDLKSRLRIALCIARALEHIHSLNIIHRDIKPDNIHISTAGSIKLIDFGIARSAGMSMTRAGFIVGTPYYMSPEQVQGREATALADVYAFGILLFELLSGAKPFRGETVERLFYSILNESIDPEPLHRAEVPQAICDVVLRCAAKNPAERFQSMTEVCAALERLIGNREPSLSEMPSPSVAFQPPSSAFPPPEPAIRKRPRWLIAVLAAGVLLAAATGVLYLAVHRRAPGSKPTVASSNQPAQRISTNTGVMNLVRAGAFQFGASKEEIVLPAFYVDRTEVTNGAYSAFCSATQHALPEGFDANRPDLPIVNVTIDDARAFARWAGKRIPTAQEWEKAGRGEDGRIYPWGDQPEAARANLSAESLMPADSLEPGASPHGALHMLGNVWEMIDQTVTPSARAVLDFSRLRPPASATEPWVMMKGFGFNSHTPLTAAVLYESASIPARYHSPDIGFRCVR